MTNVHPERTINTRLFFNIGLIVIGMVFGGLTLWSIAAPFEGAIIAPGEINVESEHKIIQHFEGGIVKEIHAQEGQKVSKGELLIRLDNTLLNTRLSSLNAQLLDLEARELRLIAERDSKSDIEIHKDPEKKYNKTTFTKNQNELFAARLQNQNVKMEILDQKIAQMNKAIEGLEADIKSKKRQSLLLDEEITSLKILVNKGLSPKPRLLALQRTQTEIEGAIQKLASDIAGTKVRIYETNLEKIQQKDEFQENVLSELSEVQTNIATISEEQSATLDQLKRLEIKSPTSGAILGIKAHTIGGVIASGTPIMYIVPQDEALIVKVKINPSDIENVKLNQPATIKFSAFSGRNTPETNGYVTKISADTLTDETTNLSHYDVIIVYDSLPTLNADFIPVPGMPVEVAIKTDSRNAISYLTKPLFDSFDRTFRE